MQVLCCQPCLKRLRIVNWCRTMNDNEISGIIGDGVLNIMSELSERTLLAEHGPYVIYKVKRYGKWIKLKALRPEYRNVPLYEEGLKKEFMIGVALEHPFVARTEQYIQDEELGNCILMEYVDGVTLDKWLEGNDSKKPLRRERSRIADQLVQAVRYMHGNGVLHRDIKPSNIIITSIGENVKLIDFGQSDSADFAFLKQAAGTAGFIAPELSSGVSSSCKSDVYSLGKVLKLLSPGLIYCRASRRAAAVEPSARLDSVEQLQNIVRHSMLFEKAVKWTGLACLFMLSALLGTHYQVRNRYSAVEQKIMEKEQRCQSALDMADSLIAQYYDSLKGFIEKSSDIMECDSLCMSFFTAKGYPMQHVDSITQACSVQFELEADVQSQVFSYLERESNRMHQSMYCTPLKDKYGQ